MIGVFDSRTGVAIFIAQQAERVPDTQMYRFKMSDGTYAEQQPNQYGVFGFVASPGAYANCRLEGTTVAFHTRPQDQAYAYVAVELPH